MKPASGRKRESAVWRHYDYDAVSDKSQCKKCQNKISGKNSTNMKRHLETAHKEDFEKVVAEENAIKASKAKPVPVRDSKPSHYRGRFF
jgi:hypothetical protein